MTSAHRFHSREECALARSRPGLLVGLQVLPQRLIFALKRLETMALRL
jgi:hypothetical protein